MAAAPKIIVIGGGLAGLSAVIKIAEMGAKVDLFSIVPVKRSHSVCAQGGINAAKNLKGEGDSTWIHFDDTVYGGDFLANQPPVKDMCEAAPGIIDLLDRMFPLIVRRRVYSTFAALAELYITAPRLRARPRASNFFMRSMSRYGGMNPKGK
jgi:succinate dehydrogenase/fumarate reductase flavoprotein subunit